MSRRPTYGGGLELSINMRLKRPTRTLDWTDYTAYVMTPIEEVDYRPKILRQGEQIRAPWMQKSNDALPSIDREICDFMDFIQPKSKDITQRRDLMRRFAALIISFNAAYSVKPVGSYVTGLYTSTSDIDVVLTTSSMTRSISMWDILYKIKASGFASNVEDILRAQVPLIRITDKITSIDIDLTASDTHGIRATVAVQKWLKGETEIKRMLIMVVKRFLALRRCGTTYTGGINSYVLVWMVVAWVEIEWPKIKNPGSGSKAVTRAPHILDLADALANLDIRRTSADDYDEQSSTDVAIPKYGRALRGFFKFYGTIFRYETQAIEIEPTPRFVRKVASLTNRAFLLSIYDPAGGSDMGSKAYGIKHIKATFKDAYEKMHEKATRVYPDGLLYQLLHT